MPTLDCPTALTGSLASLPIGKIRTLQMSVCVFLLENTEQYIVTFYTIPFRTILYLSLIPKRPFETLP